MSPRRAAAFRASRDFRVVIELIIPDEIVEPVLVDLIERRPYRIRRRLTSAAAALLQGWLLGACIDELLTKASRVGLDLAAKGARARIAATAGKRCRIELEDEPPVHRLPLGQERARRIIRGLRGQSESPGEGDNNEHRKESPEKTVSLANVSGCHGVHLATL